MDNMYLVDPLNHSKCLPISFKKQILQTWVSIRIRMFIYCLIFNYVEIFISIHIDSN